MPNPLEIAPKRRIFYELLLKILKMQQKEEVEIKFDDLQSLDSEIKEFLKYYPNFNAQLILTIASFLNTNLILKKISNHLFLKTIREQLEFNNYKSSIEKSAVFKLKQLIEERISNIEGKIAQNEVDKEQISQIIGDVFKISELLISKIKIIYDEYVNNIPSKETILKQVLISYNQLKEIDEFEKCKDIFKDLSRKLQDKWLIYSFSQIHKAITENEFNKEKLKGIIFEILLPKLDQALILFIINSLGPQTIKNLHQKTDIPTDKLFQGVISLLDRKEIEITGEKDREPIYSKIKIGTNSTELIKKNLRIIANFKGKFNNFSEESALILNNFTQFIKYSDQIEEYDEKIFQDLILQLNTNCQKLNSLITSTSQDISEERIMNRIDGMLEALNFYRLKLTFEKKENLKAISSEIDEKVSRIILESIDTDFERGQIISIIKKKGPLNIIELSEHINLPKEKIYSQLIQLKQDNKIKIVETKEAYDLYDVPRINIEEENLVENLFNMLQNFRKIQKNLEEISSDIKFNLDKIHNLLNEFFDNLTKISNFTYLNQKFDKKIYEYNFVKCKKVQDNLLNIKGKVKVKKTEINFNELVPIIVPSTEEEFSHLIKPKQLVGFGTIKRIEKKCISCRSCQDICEEAAVSLKNVLNLPLYFELSKDDLSNLPETKRMLIETIKKIAVKKPDNKIKLPLGAIGYGDPEFEPLNCIACKKCVERCPNKAIEFEEVWNFPEIIKKASQFLITED